MLKELNLGRELNEIESVKVEGGELAGPKKHKKFRLKLELEYESSPIKADTVAVRDTVAVCDSIR